MNAVLYDNHDGEPNLRQVINLLDFFDGDHHHDDNVYAYNDRFYDDNISSFSGSSSCDAVSSLCCLQVSCPDGQPLWFLVLRFMKMKVLSMARSYNAKPAVLIAGPLLVGIMIGFYLGRIVSTTTTLSKTSETVAMSSSRSTTSELSTPSLPEQVTTTSTVLHHKMLFRIRQIHGRAVAFASSIIYWFSSFIALSSTAQSQRQQQSEETQKALSGLQSRSSSSFSTNPTDSTASSSRLDDDKESSQDGSEKVVGDEELLHVREDRVRSNLKSHAGTDRESGVPVTDVPRHIGVIMDGNRRYGQAKYGSASRGHWEGSSKLVEFAKWCLAERVEVLTVFAFSTENWRRDPAEVAALMEIFVTYCDELRREALERNIKIVALSTNRESIPSHVQDGVRRMVDDTKHCDGMIMNICLSYGSRSEITAASRSLAIDAVEKKLDPHTIDEAVFGQRLLTFDCGDPDILIRTSGEVRISNFLLWQLAYTELFFLDKPWPAIEKEDLLEVIRSFAGGRSRRFGK